MKALLKIPYDKKDWAKNEAKNNSCALWFDKDSFCWNFSGKTIPDTLINFLVPGSVIEENTPKRSFDELEFPDFSGNNVINDIKKESPLLNQEYYTYFIDYPYELIMNKQAKPNGLNYHSLYKASFIKTNKVPDELVPYMSQPFSYEYWLELFVNKKPRPELANVFVKQDVWKAREHQLKAASMAKNAFKNNVNGFLIADDVGLGKTISSVQACKEINLTTKMFNKKTVLVVTTISAIAHWRNTFLNFDTSDMQILIINYDRLQKLFFSQDNLYKGKAKSKKAKNKRIASKALAPIFNICIFDESHKMKNSTSLRSKLGRKIADNSDFNIYLSATAGQNPLELSYLIPLFSSLTKTDTKHLENFEDWCAKELGVKKGKYGGLVWDGSKESIEKIQQLLFKGKVPAAIRRLPEDIAGWPEINRIMQEASMTPEKLVLYNSCWNEFKTERKKEIEKQNISKKKDIGFVASLRFRQKASLLKIEQTVEKIIDAYDNNYQVAVSVAFIETSKEIQKALEKQKISCAIINGSQKKEENEIQRMKFQKGELKVILFTVEEAISLHQGEHNNIPRILIIHDIRWSAISMKQIEGRTHRDGKFSQVYWQYLDGSIEKDIASIVVKKMIQMKSMVGDDTQTLQEIEDLLDKKIIM